MIQLDVRRRVPASLSQKRLQLLLRRVRRVSSTSIGYTTLSVVFVSDREIQTLNRRFRKKNAPTDVLSFDYGEIFISVPTARRQAKEHALSLRRELELLFVHGLLHTMGFDHMTVKENQIMSQLENKILRRSGLVEKSKIKNQKAKLQVKIQKSR